MKKTKKTRCSEETVQPWSPWSQSHGARSIMTEEVWERFGFLAMEWKSEGAMNSESGGLTER